MKGNWKLLSWLNVLIGAWLIVSPFVIGFSGWSYHQLAGGFGGWIDYAIGLNIGMGILIFFVALAGALTDAVWAAWTLVGLGLLLWWAPIVVGFFDVRPAVYDDMLAAILIEVLALGRLAVDRGRSVRPARLG